MKFSLKTKTNKISSLASKNEQISQLYYHSLKKKKKKVSVSQEAFRSHLHLKFKQ